MGLTINDNLALDIGLNKLACYISFGAHSLTITKLGADSYQVSCPATVWADQVSRLTGVPPIQGLSIDIVVNKLDLDSNLYAQLYTQLKKSYVSTSDVL